MEARVLKLKSWAPWVTIGGVAILLVGLAWDAVLHSMDSGLAAREGIFSPSNPGHVLFGGGIAVIVLGALMYLAGRAAESGRVLAYALPGIALITLASGSVGIAAATGTLGGPAHTHDEAVAHDDSTVNKANSKLPGVVHDHGEATAITTLELEAGARLVSDTIAGTKRFEDLKVAQSEGYFLLAGGRQGLAHYHNQAYHTDGKILDPQKPEELIYLRKSDGTAQLVGVMFLMPSANQAGPRVAGPLTAWHAHDNLCFSASLGRISGFADANGKCAAGSVFMGKTPEMMHIWVLDNPNGVFSDDMEPDVLVKLLANR